MIVGDKITLDPNLVIVCGDHRYRITRPRGHPDGERWTCDRCGEHVSPAGRCTPCPAA